MVNGNSLIFQVAGLYELFIYELNFSNSWSVKAIAPLISLLLRVSSTSLESYSTPKYSALFPSNLCHGHVNSATFSSISIQAWRIDKYKSRRINVYV